MALTKLDYLRIAERVEAMYMNCSTQLILNIVRHLASGKGLSTAEWQLKKLSEMQSLTRESMEIIAANTGKRREAVEQAFREVFGIGLADTEKELQAAVKAGKLIPVPSVEESEAMRQLLQAYIGQADDALNLVNTVMLDSTLSRYRYYVNQIDTESQKKAAEILAKLGATDEAGLGTNLAYTQNVLNTQSTGVVTGAVARQKAVRDAIKDLASKGITGFVDAGGHHWTPEAYVNMDIRTTAHNVAIEAQKQRSAEYGVSTFQISTHAGARPLCAPYQGWICSWDNSGGTVTDLYGKEYQVHGINETSYGEAAGIFGINCGHFPETFVDGYSIPRYEELTPEQEKQNEIEYAQSQTQRELEREIRQAKTEAAAYSAAGDKEAFNKAALKVKDKQGEYKSFCEQTGRTPRPDRTQVSTYSRSEASKVSWSNRKNPTEPKPPRDFTPKPIVTTNVNVDQFRDAAIGATNKIEFWMNFTENQQSAFKASGLSLDELYDMAKEQTPTSEWRLPNAGNADSFAIKHDFSTHGIRFEEVPPRSDGWMADANFDGVIRVRSGGLGDDWDFIISHEAGHQLSNASPELQRLIVENPANILGRYNIKHMYFDGVYMEYNPEEAFATCVSHYVRHPESFREKYPEAYKAIDNLFTASPSAREYVENVRKAYIERFIK